MGDHIHNKRNPNKRHKYGFSENQDMELPRKAKASFKHYLQDLEEQLIEQELAEDGPDEFDADDLDEV